MAKISTYDLTNFRHFLFSYSRFTEPRQEPLQLLQQLQTCKQLHNWHYYNSSNSLLNNNWQVSNSNCNFCNYVYEEQNRVPSGCHTNNCCIQHKWYLSIDTLGQWRWCKAYISIDPSNLLLCQGGLLISSTSFFFLDVQDEWKECDCRAKCRMRMWILLIQIYLFLGKHIQHLPHYILILKIPKADSINSILKNKLLRHKWRKVSTYLADNLATFLFDIPEM